MSELIIFGAGDIARLANYYFTRDSDHTVAAFTVDPQYKSQDEFEGLPLVGFDEVTNAYPPDRYAMFIALSYARMNTVRRNRYFEAKKLGYEIATYVSSRCTWLTDHPPGENCFILEDNTVQPFVKIGNNVTLWSGNHIGHDSVIGDHCFFTSHVVLSGNCRVGEECFLGVNATVRDSARIAPRTLVGAGAVIMQDTIEGGVYLPPRAQLIEKRSHEIGL